MTYNFTAGRISCDRGRCRKSLKTTAWSQATKDSDGWVEFSHSTVGSRAAPTKHVCPVHALELDDFLQYGAVDGIAELESPQ